MGALVGLLAVVVFGLVLLARRHLPGHLQGGDRERPMEQSLSDRERIRRLLEDNGGRMHQSEIVTSVEWSKAKVSRLLTELEEDDEISKLRLGRENLVCLSGREPSASKAPERVGTD